jgi:hypothetical protein
VSAGLARDFPNSFRIVPRTTLGLDFGRNASTHSRCCRNVDEQGSTKIAKNLSSANSSPDPGIDLNCNYEHLQNPPESFHCLYDKQGSTHVHQEADVTPQTLEGFRTQFDGSQQPLHAMRSDKQSWQGALAGLTEISMSSTVAIINHNSAMQHESDGRQINGYNTIHYSIDTARFSGTERQMLLSPANSKKKTPRSPLQDVR